MTYVLIITLTFGFLTALLFGADWFDKYQERKGIARIAVTASTPEQAEQLVAEKAERLLKAAQLDNNRIAA